MEDPTAPHHSNAEASDLLNRSSTLYRRIAEILDHDGEHDHAGAILAEVTARITITHGTAILALMPTGATTSMIALLRIQYEALVRALWMFFSADDPWLERYITAIAGKSLKDPDYPSVAKMLEQLEPAAPPDVASMLGLLKTNGWGPMNSFVHTGILPMYHMLGDPPPTVAENNLLNANGLATMAAMLIAVISNDPHRTRAVRDLQLQFRDCLPPLLPHEPRA